MKKILLSLFIVCSFVVVKAQQVTLNEIYTEPGGGNSEFFELYNTAGGAQNVDCFTLLIYWRTSATVRGWYVLDLPNSLISSPGFFVGAAANPFNVQAQTGLAANFNWNDLDFRNGITFGYLQKYQLNGTNTGYTDISPLPAVAVNDLFSDVSIGGGHNYLQLLYVNGVWSNTFWGGGSSSTLPVEVTGMAALPVTILGASCGVVLFNATFNHPAEFVNQSPGNDNGFIRLRDGQCGAWAKGSNAVKHSPGSTNGNLSNTGSLAVSVLYPVTITGGTRTLTYTVNSGGPADAYPVTVFVYEDRRPALDENLGTTNIFEAELPNTIFGDRDTSITHYSRSITSAGGTFNFVIDSLFSPAAYPFPWPNPDLREQRNFFILFETPQGCFDQILPTTMGGPLPVKLSKFEAKRIGKQDVNLSWQTASEEKNRGFDVQRFIGSGNWESVGFVSSKAIDGMSSSALNYEFNDINNIKGITQYRLKLVDMDGKSSFSLIRSIRGEGQKGKTIVYPNPSGTGKVSIVFEEVNVTRDVSLIDMNGRTIKQWKGMTNNNIQIENLNAGFYSIIILNKETGEQSVEKLIINKR